jgi:murein DD-endopeptidase MepM/ murein hydrolase activator NlpD
MISRRSALLGAAALSIAGSAKALQHNSPLSLRTVPTRIYRSTFNPRENLDGWVFFLILESPAEGAFRPASLRIVYRAAGEVVREDRIMGGALAAIARQDIPPSRLTGQPPSPPVHWPQAFRIHCYQPRLPAVDELVLELRASDSAGREHRVDARVPIVDFQQRTALVFPFRGPGIISQAGVLGGGHRNRSGGFAVDALGLGPTYAPMLRSGSDRPQDYAGWGRPIIAPAAGLVVQARTDRPDQPRDGESNPAYYAPEYPNGGDVGNHVVIDHGNGEFSLIAHMRMGSVRVRAGERVAQGQTLGELGNSGDTSGPHVHYQLQDGPRWEFADGLPVRFGNVSSLSRGSYFDAR